MEHAVFSHSQNFLSSTVAAPVASASEQRWMKVSFT
jgi:hypothetical protein